MVIVGDRVRLSSGKAVEREGIVIAVTGTMLRVRWPSGEETTVVPAPGTLAVLAAEAVQEVPATRGPAGTKRAPATKRPAAEKTTSKKSAPAKKSAAATKAPAKKSAPAKKAASAKKAPAKKSAGSAKKAKAAKKSRATPPSR